MPTTPAALPLPQAPLKGRGTVWAIAHRYSADQREPADDGWGTLEQAVRAEEAPPATRIIEQRVKTPDGHFKFPHLWPVKLPRAGRSNYGSTAALSARREAASLRR